MPFIRVPYREDFDVRGAHSWRGLVGDERQLVCGSRRDMINAEKNQKMAKKKKTITYYRYAPNLRNTKSRIPNVHLLSMTVCRKLYSLVYKPSNPSLNPDQFYDGDDEMV